MSEQKSIVYIDHSEVRDGRLDELKAAIKELAEFVKAKEPRIIAYNVYFTEGGKRMTVIHIHPDSASLEFHMKVAGPEFPKFADFVRMLTINIYGEINEGLLEQLRKKAQMLGNATVVVHGFHAGFDWFGGR
jgi:quinol monooxygenase YgiN